MNIYLATWMLEKSQGETLTKVNAKTRLMSYWHTKDQTKQDVRIYIKTGKV